MKYTIVEGKPHDKTGETVFEVWSPEGVFIASLVPRKDELVIVSKHIGSSVLFEERQPRKVTIRWNL